MADNRRRRTYGVSWSRSREVAAAFAQNLFQRTCEGGSVLLETDAPRAAIISAIKDTWRSEDELIVDRRHLGSVCVLARYPQRDLTERN